MLWCVCLLLINLQGPIFVIKEASKVLNEDIHIYISIFHTLNAYLMYVYHCCNMDPIDDMLLVSMYHLAYTYCL